MPSTHKHSHYPHHGPHGHHEHGEVSRVGNRRSAAVSGSNATEEDRKSTGHSGGHRREANGKGGANGKIASGLCVMAAFLAFGISLLAELVASSRHESVNPFVNAGAGLFTVAALGAGGYALIIQLRYWSQRVRRRLQVGLTIALLTLLMETANFCERRAPSVGKGVEAASVKAAGKPVAPEDQSLFKPGWYGELKQEGLMAVVSSFAEDAAESRLFNRRVAKPVSYAVLSVINLGCSSPVVLRSLQVGLLLDSGEEVQSLAVKPLLNPSGMNESLLKRLVEPQKLAIGVMVPDIPVCREQGFQWGRVRGVKLTFDSGTVTIPGRMMTAVEKRALLEKAAVPKPAAATTNLAAEAWFKDL